VWQEFVDDDSGCTYYWNESTGETTWELPSDDAPEQQPATGPASVWTQFVDDESGCPYWYNEQSGESTWEDPNCGSGTSGDTSEHGRLANLPTATGTIPPVSVTLWWLWDCDE
jgi:hypothetical protein